MMEEAGIYEGDITGKVESSGTKVHMMDLLITIDRQKGRFDVALHSKKLDPKFKALNFYCFPHITSKLSNSCKLGIVNSQTIRFARLISRRVNFVKECAELFRILIDERGYSEIKVFRRLYLVMHSIIPIFFSSVGAALKAVKYKLINLRIARRARRQLF